MNDKNLKPNSERTPSERVELARKAGKASGEARRLRKTLAQVLRDELEKPISEESQMTRKEYLASRLVMNLKDNIKPYEFKLLCEILGEVKQSIDLNVSARDLSPDEAAELYAKYKAQTSD